MSDGHAVRRGWGPAVALACLLGVVAPVGNGTPRGGNARGDEPGPVRPTWECLPEETAAVVRVPGGRAFVAALVERTKLGGLLFSPERIRRREELWAKIAEEGENSVEARLWRGLREYGLEADDPALAFEGEAGAALVVPGLEAGRLAVLLGWMEPGEGPAERMLAGLGRRLAEIVDEVVESGRPAKRTDLEMAGRPVTWVRLPIDDKDEATGAVRPIATLHLLATRCGGRLVAAIGVAARRGAIRLKMNDGPGGGLAIDTTAGGEAAGADGEDGEDGENDEQAAAAAERAAEEAGRIFARFLTAHASTEEAPLGRVLDTAGVRDGMPAGVPLVEAVVRPVGFGAAAGAEANAALAAYGLDAVGPLVWRQSLDGTTWRSNIVVSLPAPRHGLARLLDEAADPAAVPAFVSREPLGFLRVSLDLGRAYTLAREAIFAGDEPPPGNGLGVLETQALALAGMELPALLSALGTRHVLVSYPARIDLVAKRLLALGNRAADRPPSPSPDETPLALVWEVADEAPFQRLLALVPATAGEVRDEQGFRMLRMPGVAVALGQKHLVLAIGDAVAEKTLAAIRTPPPPDASLADSPVHRRARELVPPAPAGLYGVSDHTRGGGWLGYAVRLAAALSERDGAVRAATEKEREAAAARAAMMPTAAEIEGLLGASTVLWRSTEQGVRLESATELPAQ